MQSKNKPAQTLDEKERAGKIAALSCVVCDESGPSAVHEPEQGLWFISLPLCWACHQGPHGWHGDRLRWKLHKMTELKAIDKTARMLA